jgi:hypothetical protein
MLLARVMILIELFVFTGFVVGYNLMIKSERWRSL